MQDKDAVYVANGHLRGMPLALQSSRLPLLLPNAEVHIWLVIWSPSSVDPRTLAIWLGREGIMVGISGLLSRLCHAELSPNWLKDPTLIDPFLGSG